MSDLPIDEATGVADADAVAGGTEDAGAPAVEADPLEVALRERDEYLDALRRLQAEFENFRKRNERLQHEAADRVARALVDKLLPALDAFDLAVKHVGEEGTSGAGDWLQAVALLNDVLAKEGLDRLEPIGEEFDPTTQQAVGHVADEDPDAGEGAGGTVVVDVMRAGYAWRGSVIRPAMVTVKG